MGYGFWNDKDNFSVSNSMTAAVFELAKEYGWVDPMEATQLGCVPERDAKELANALERALSDLQARSTESPESEFHRAGDRELLRRIVRLARSGGFMYQH